VRTEDAGAPYAETGQEIDLHLVARVEKERWIHGESGFAPPVAIEILAAEEIETEVDSEIGTWSRAQAETDAAHAGVGRGVTPHRRAFQTELHAPFGPASRLRWRRGRRRIGVRWSGRWQRRQRRLFGR